MARRERAVISDSGSDYEEGDAGGNEKANESNDDYLQENLESEIQSTVNRVVRLILGRELKSQFIRREKISLEVNTKRHGLDLIIKRVNAELEKVYGLTLVETPVIQKRQPEKKSRVTKTTNVKVKQPFAIVSCLEPKSKKVLGELWQTSTNVNPEADAHGSKYFVPKYKKTEGPLSNIELVRTGIMLYIVSMLILAENYLLEDDLERGMERMGISKDLNKRNSNLGMNLQELVSDLIKKDYINKEVSKGTVESENRVIYSLGRRSLVEFPPQAVVEYVRVLYGEKFNADQTVMTIERTYGVKLESEMLLNAESVEKDNDSENQGLLQDNSEDAVVA